MACAHIARNADGHRRRTLGVSGCNDAVESKFAAADYIMCTYRGISVLNASGMVQQRTARTTSTGRSRS